MKSLILQPHSRVELHANIIGLRLPCSHRPIACAFFCCKGGWGYGNDDPLVACVHCQVIHKILRNVLRCIITLYRCHMPEPWQQWSWQRQCVSWRIRGIPHTILECFGDWTGESGAVL